MYMSLNTHTDLRNRKVGLSIDLSSFTHSSHRLFDVFPSPEMTQSRTLDAALIIIIIIIMENTCFLDCLVPDLEKNEKTS